MKSIKNIAIVVILTLFLMLPLYKLNQGFSHDDLWDIRCAKNNVSSILKATIINNGAIPADYPPGYFIILHYWLKIVGLSEFGLRLLSLIIGYLSIILFYFITKKLFDRKTALVGLFLLVPYHAFVESSQSIRMYSILFLLALLNFNSFLRLIEKNNLERRIAFTVTSIIVTYFHFYGILLVLSEIIAILMMNKSKKQTEGMVSMSFLIFLVLSPMFLNLIPALKMTSSETNIVFSLQSLIELFLVNIWNWVLFVVLLSFYVCGSIILSKDKKKRGAYLTNVAIILIAVSSIILTACVIPFKARHYTYMFPMMFMTSAYFLVKIRGKMRAIFIISLIVLYSLTLNQYYTNPLDSKFIDWKGASNHIAENANQNDTVLLTWYAYEPSSYYLKEYLSLSSKDIKIIQIRDKSLTEIENEIILSGRVWIIFHEESNECIHQCRTDNLMEVIEYLNSRYVKIKEASYPGNLYTYLYDTDKII